LIQTWQFNLSGKSWTRSEKKSLPCGEQKRHNLLREDLAKRTGDFRGAVGAIHIGGLIVKANHRII
jgi:hypothetical protein